MYVNFNFTFYGSEIYKQTTFEESSGENSLAVLMGCAEGARPRSLGAITSKARCGGRA